MSKRLVALNPNKLSGPDGFHLRILKELAQELAQPLAVIFHSSLHEKLEGSTNHPLVEERRGCSKKQVSV